jgi:hypothetical protein
VVQRLAAVYGMRQDMLEDVLIPGMCDTLGVAAGTALLRAELPQLEAEAERSCRGRQAKAEDRYAVDRVRHHLYARNLLREAAS